MARPKIPRGTTGRGKPGVQKTYNLKSRIVSQLRRLFMFHPGLKAVRDRTRIERGRYQCESCGHTYGPKEMRCDHVEPVVGPEGFVDWNRYINRMFDAIPDGIQHLCRNCHAEKTRAEARARIEARRQLKLEEAG